MDRKPDILWHNGSTNETQIWFMNGSRLTSRATVLDENGNPIFVGLPWSIVGSNDMDGYGKADIVWHNESTGETQIWFMDGYKLTSRATVLGEDGQPILVGLPWSIAAADKILVPTLFFEKAVGGRISRSTTAGSSC